MAWTETALTRLLGIELPIVQAPMAGGYSTPAHRESLALPTTVTRVLTGLG